jgi:hypothetical protein
LVERRADRPYALAVSKFAAAVDLKSCAVSIAL